MRCLTLALCLVVVGGVGFAVQSPAAGVAEKEDVPREQFVEIEGPANLGAEVTIVWQESKGAPLKKKRFTPMLPHKERLHAIYAHAWIERDFKKFPEPIGAPWSLKLTDKGRGPIAEGDGKDTGPNASVGNFR